MRNKVLEKLKTTAEQLFNGAYQEAATVEDEKSAVIISHDGRGNRLTVKIEENPEYQPNKR